MPPRRATPLRPRRRIAQLLERIVAVSRSCRVDRPLPRVERAKARRVEQFGSPSASLYVLQRRSTTRRADGTTFCRRSSSRATAATSITSRSRGSSASAPTSAATSRSWRSCSSSVGAPRAGPRASRCDVLAEPLPARVGVQRIARAPVDRREVTLVGQRRVERPQGAGHAQRGLRDRLGEVAARRRDRADDRHRAHRAPAFRTRARDRRARRTGRSGWPGTAGSLPRQASPAGAPRSRATPPPSARCCRPSSPRGSPCRGSTRRSWRRGRSRPRAPRPACSTCSRSARRDP